MFGAGSGMSMNALDPYNGSVQLGPTPGNPFGAAGLFFNGMGSPNSIPMGGQQLSP
jgi:hypothetical protein